MRKVHAGRALEIAALAACLAAGGWPHAHAFTFRSDSGDWTGSWDTTIGYGMGWRVVNPDCRLIATANGGCGYSPNIDDGDLNYLHKAEYTEALTGVTELSLNYKDRFGGFVRASGLYDFSVMGDHVDRTPLRPAQKSVVVNPGHSACTVTGDLLTASSTATASVKQFIQALVEQ